MRWAAAVCTCHGTLSTCTSLFPTPASSPAPPPGEPGGGVSVRAALETSSLPQKQDGSLLELRELLGAAKSICGDADARAVSGNATVSTPRLGSPVASRTPVPSGLGPRLSPTSSPLNAASSHTWSPLRSPLPCPSPRAAQRRRRGPGPGWPLGARPRERAGQGGAAPLSGGGGATRD